MKKIAVRLSVAVLLVSLGVWIGILSPNALEAESNARIPGSVEDPVVTKSYVDEQIAKLGGGNTGGGTTTPTTPTTPIAESALEVVSVPAGKTLMAGQGTEVIVRVGKAVAFSSNASGIADLTDGTEVTNGKVVPPNHLMLFPREGRGIMPNPNQKNGLTVLVKGSYSLQ